jgi:hypothetical protein
MDFERVVVGSAANRLSQVKNRYSVMPFVFCVDVTLSYKIFINMSFCPIKFNKDVILAYKIYLAHQSPHPLG